MHWTILNLWNILSWNNACMRTVRKPFYDLWAIDPKGTCRNQFGTTWNQFVHGRARNWIFICFYELWCLGCRLTTVLATCLKLIGGNFVSYLWVWLEIFFFGEKQENVLEAEELFRSGWEIWERLRVTRPLVPGYIGRLNSLATALHRLIQLSLRYFQSSTNVLSTVFELLGFLELSDTDWITSIL